MAALLVLLSLPACGRTAGGPSASPRRASVPAQPSGPVPPPHAHKRTPLTAAQARRAFGAFAAAFYVPNGGRSFHHASTLGGRADFWKQAEIIEMVEDAYASTRSPVYRRTIVDLLAGTRQLYGRNWLKRRWNDDVEWMVIAYLRAYRITGDQQYLAVAKKNFDGAYARGWSSDLGGGMWWTTDKNQKNVTTNCPAAIAACMLYRIVHDPLYLRKAVGLYGWVRAELYDAKLGVVRDNISLASSGSGQSTVMDPQVLSYNQGTFIGAADLLYLATRRRAYYDDALGTLTASRRVLTTHGILHSESPGGNVNGGGFKGIFARWAVRFTRDNHITTFDRWFRRNAETAWANRSLRGLLGQNFTRPTGNGVLYSFDCSSGVVLMEVMTARG